MNRSRLSNVLMSVACLASAVALVSGVGTAQASPQPLKGGVHLTLAPLSPAAASRAHVAATSWYHIANGDTQCLDADSNHWGQNGDNVQLWACNNHGEQSWTRGTSHIVNADGQCLDADSSHWGQNGDNVQLWACNNHGEQNWPTS